jgi:hypothetical protein
MTNEGYGFTFNVPDWRGTAVYCEVLYTSERRWLFGAIGYCPRVAVSGRGVT